MKRLQPQRRALSEEQREEAARLKEIWDARKQALKLTQEKAAEEMGFSTQGAVSHYLNARIPLNTDAILAFASLLGVSPGEIRPALAGAQLPVPTRPSPRSPLRQADILIQQVEGVLSPLGLGIADLQGTRQQIRARIAQVLQPGSDTSPEPTRKLTKRSAQAAPSARSTRKSKTG